MRHILERLLAQYLRTHEGNAFDAHNTVESLTKFNSNSTLQRDARDSGFEREKGKKKEKSLSPHQSSVVVKNS